MCMIPLLHSATITDDVYLMLSLHRMRTGVITAQGAARRSRRVKSTNALARGHACLPALSGANSEKLHFQATTQQALGTLLVATLLWIRRGRI